MREFKVVVLGPGGVGKSALTVQFISGKFVERYDPTVEDFYRKEIEVDGDPAILEILDTAGTEQFASMRDLYIKNGQGFIIVFSLTSRQSFQDIKLIREQILRVKGTNRVPIVLAANKFDIVETHREVDSDEGCRLANEWMVPYMETSAKNSSIVNTLFTEIVKEMNFKSISHGSSGRKEKKKFKMLTNTNLSSNINNKTNLSNNSSHSFTSNAKESTAKFKKADYDAHLSSCSFFHNCAKCFCVRSSPNKNYSSTNRSSNSFYGQETSNRCSIL